MSSQNRHGVPGKSCHLDSNICLSKIPTSLCINGTFTYMQITHAMGTDAPPYHHRGWFLHFSLVFLLFGTWNLMSVFPKYQLKGGLENTFPLSFGQMTLGPENSATFLSKINKCLPLCIIQRFQVAFVDAVADCVA